jgi:transposase
MKYVVGNPRNQAPLIPLSLEEMIGPENDVRVIDLFVDALPLDEYGFKINQGENGRPAYHPADLLKLFLYGYLNRVRPSRQLEKECRRNLEVRWLLKELTPVKPTPRLGGAICPEWGGNLAGMRIYQ